MNWKKKKVYGSYKTSSCSFCGKIATQKTEAGLDVCRLHLQAKLEEIKCTCGKWLEQKVSKFGAYFKCVNCGNINYQKAMEMKELTKIGIPGSEEPKPEISKEKPKSYFNKDKENKEITITTDDAFYFS